jgi:hypothetical protein
VKRRAFLAAAAGVTLSVGGALFVARRVRFGRVGWYLARFEEFGAGPVARLRRHYQWLAVSPAAFDDYAADYQRRFRPIGHFSPSPPDFYTRFLLSTNFFTNTAAATTRAPVTYTTLYAPGVTPCYNPLAQPPPSDAELPRDTHGARG